MRERERERERESCMPTVAFAISIGSFYVRRAGKEDTGTTWTFHAFGVERSGSCRPYGLGTHEFVAAVKYDHTGADTFCFDAALLG